MTSNTHSNMNAKGSKTFKAFQASKAKIFGKSFISLSLLALSLVGTPNTANASGTAVTSNAIANPFMKPVIPTSYTYGVVATITSKELKEQTNDVAGRTNHFKTNITFPFLPETVSAHQSLLAINFVYPKQMRVQFFSHGKDKPTTPLANTLVTWQCQSANCALNENGATTTTSMTDSDGYAILANGTSPNQWSARINSSLLGTVQITAKAKSSGRNDPAKFDITILDDLPNQTQCVLNKSGFTAHVAWYSPQDMIVTQQPSGKTSLSFRDSSVQPINTKEMKSSGESCMTGKRPLIAKIRVVGGEDAKIATVVGIGTIMAVGGVGLCAASAGLACEVALLLIPDVVGASVELMPDPKKTFYFNVPPSIGSSDHRLILRGSVWDPRARWEKK